MSAGGNGAPGQVKITCSQNAPPNAPAISGPTSGFTKTLYPYTFTSTDSDSDTLRYGIDWNDDDTVDEWAPALGYVSSGTAGSTTHSWNSSNTQTFQALAEDSQGNRSGWSPYSVNMSPNAPTVLLTASSDRVTNGQSSTLTWSSANATACTGTNFSTGGATTNTSPGVSVSPTQTTTYTVTCTGQGNQEASDSKTVTYTCTSVNQCSGSNVVNSCTGAIVQNCTYQCGGGACISPPAMQVIGALEARPSLVLEGDTTHLFWNIDNADASTCSVTDSHNVTVSTGAASSGEDGIETAPIESQTVFTLTCTGEDGQLFTDTTTVSVVPVFLEN